MSSSAFPISGPALLEPLIQGRDLEAASAGALMRACRAAEPAMVLSHAGVRIGFDENSVQKLWKSVRDSRTSLIHTALQCALLVG